MHNPTDNPIDITQLKFEKYIVEDSGSTISKYTDPTSNLSIVSKTVRSEYRDSLESEIAILQKLTHPNIIQYYRHVVLSGIPYLLMEYMSYSLADVLNENSLLNDNVESNGPAREKHLQIAFGLAFGLQYLHQNNIVHCDIKPGNVLVNKDCSHVKICDFGLSNDLSKNTSNIEWRKGTLDWLAPEIAKLFIERKGGDIAPFKIDIWPLGQILLQLYINTRGKPYYSSLPNASNAVLLNAISNGRHDSIPEHKPLSKVISWCLRKNPDDRPDATQIIGELHKLKPGAITEVTEALSKLKP
ncbi:MAG: serine/threonine-protein kinase [Gammaproteobacteria bacterium]